METCAVEDKGISSAVLMFLNMFPTLLSQVLELACKNPAACLAHRPG